MCMMAKRNVNISVDSYIHEQAKALGINISELAERAIVKKLNPENPINTVGDKCEYCLVAMRKATANDMNGLYWFLPDEKWICPKCEHSFVEQLIKSTNGA